jgi:type I restriction enzyme R subunit
LKYNEVESVLEDGEQEDIFSPEYFEKLSDVKMPASKLEILVKMLRKQIKEYSKTNQMAAKKFQEMLEDTIRQYHERRKHLTAEEAGEAQEHATEDIIRNATEQALRILKDMNADRESFRKIGLTFEEKAFYDALTRPQAVKDFYTNDQLVALTKELTETLRRNRTIDWNRRDSERANMRRLVKRLLKHYNYPPEDAEDAMNTVLKQCEQWADSDESINKRKLANVEDDRDVRNLIFNRLLMDAGISNGELQREVIELYGVKYPNMTLNDWRHVIEDYTHMVREASRPIAQELSMEPRQYGMAADEIIEP